MGALVGSVLGSLRMFTKLLVTVTVTAEALVPAVTNLLQLKMETPEMGLGPRIDIINDYLDASIEEVNQLIQTFSDDERVTWDELNELFLKTVAFPN